ncbi:MAG: sugar phosphate isomerase/epimerase family protein [Erysipelotrichaceae bacterium]|nr:sugar phosphate isomerase/epimerase family protein [Erysipelotrichaceae bacterium]
MELYPMNINYRYYDLEYFFAKCKEEGFKKVELWLCPQHFLINAQFSQNPNALLDLMAKYNIAIDVICGEQNNPKPNNIAARNELLIENTFSYFCRVIDLAETVNATKILVTPGWNYYDESDDAARKRSIKMLRRICDYAQEKNIKVAMETIWSKSSLVANTIEKAKEIFEGVDRTNFGFTIDFGAIHYANESIDDWYKAFPDNIWHVHFVDGDPTGHKPWGHGSLVMKDYIDAFKKYGYNGGLSMEYVDASSFIKPEQFLKETKEIFNKCI